MDKKFLERQIESKWRQRPPEQRRSADTYEFIGEMWSVGLRLASSEPLHYQHVMNVIRSSITDGG
jgi:hypothetical protein